MTLSDTLADAALRERLSAQAREAFAAALAAPLTCDAICVYTEARPGAPFMLTQRYALG